MPRFPDDPGSPGDIANGNSADSTVSPCRGSKLVIWRITATNNPGDQNLTYTPRFRALSGDDNSVAGTLAAANAFSVVAPTAGQDLRKGGMLVVRAGQATADPHSRFAAVECYLRISSAGATTVTAVNVETTVFDI